MEGEIYKDNNVSYLTSPKDAKGNALSFHTTRLGVKWRKHLDSNDEGA